MNELNANTRLEAQASACPGLARAEVGDLGTATEA